MDNDEYEQVQAQVMMIGSLVRELDLDGLIARAETADAIGPLLSPSHYIAGKDKLELVLNLARKLRAFQTALPTMEQAKKLDVDAQARRERLGV